MSVLPIPVDLNIHTSITIQQIISIMRQRRSMQSLLIQQMIDIRDRYNGDIVLPMVDVQESPTMDVPTPRLIAMGIDANARRAASSKPGIYAPAKSLSKKSDIKNADVRKKMMYAKWQESQMELKMYRFYRQYSAYGTAALMVMPDEKTKSARIELRDPLTAYPELRDPGDIREPLNCGFIYGRSIDWIVQHYPQAKELFANSASRNWDTLWDVVEWIDEWEIVIGIMGPRMPAFAPQDARPYGYTGFELARWPNKAGCVPVAMPQRITLDRVMGQMSTMIDTVDLHARMVALEVLAAEKHVFPDMVLVSEAGEIAQVTSGDWRDGRTGGINTVQGARAIEYLTSQLPPFIPAVVEGLEDSIRQSGGSSALFGGDNEGMRTGRGVSTLGSFEVDPAVEEMQRAGGHVLSLINEFTVSVEKGYFPSATRTCYTGLQGDSEMVEYKPSDIDSGHNVVRYPMPGADISQISVALGQLVGGGMMSKHTARAIHPLVDDADQEEMEIQVEQVQEAVFQGLAQQIAGGQIPPNDAARILELLTEGQPLQDAITMAHDEAQKRQATAAAPPDPSQGQVAPPGAQPGLAAPGQGAEQPVDPSAQVQPPAPGLADVHQLFNNLRQPPKPTALDAPAAS